MPVNSVIGFPEGGDTVRAGRDETLEAKGYALLRGPDGPVVKVEVSVNEDISWQEAEISSDQNVDGRWAWVLLQALVKPPAWRGRKILSRVTDKGCNVQEKDPAWNLRVAYSGYGEVRDLIVEAD
jgi:sulfite oxidase